MEGKEKIKGKEKNIKKGGREGTKQMGKGREGKEQKERRREVIKQKG